MGQTGEKSLRFQTKTDTCGRGPIYHNSDRGENVAWKVNSRFFKFAEVVQWPRPLARGGNLQTKKSVMHFLLAFYQPCSHHLLRCYPLSSFPDNYILDVLSLGCHARYQICGSSSKNSQGWLKTNRMRISYNSVLNTGVLSIKNEVQSTVKYLRTPHHGQLWSPTIWEGQHG